MGAHSVITAAREPAVLGPSDKSFVASAAEIDTWLDGAHPGDRCIYARIAVLPNGSAGGMRARGFHDRGLVTLERGRWSSNPTLFEFRMRRTMRGTPPAPVSPPPRLSADERALFDYIEGRAEAGQPMETNNVIAERLRWRDGRFVDQLLSHLLKKGLVRRQAIIGRPFRIMTIAATGMRTQGNG